MSEYMLSKNPFQGPALKALFICTGGILRSATAAHWAHKNLGWNTRSCGVMPESIPPIHMNLLDWADRIYCMEPFHALNVNQMARGAYDKKVLVMNVPDNFGYHDPKLVRAIAHYFQEEEK